MVRKNKKLKRTKKTKSYSRKTKYDPEIHPHAAEVACAELGANLKDLQKLFGISELALRNWRIRHPEFASAVQRGTDYWAQTEIEPALVKLCLGYEYSEKEYKYIGDNGNSKKVLVKEVVKQKEPSLGAIKFWLANRLPDRWRQVKHIDPQTLINLNLQQTNISSIKPNMDTSCLSDSELKVLTKLMDEVLKTEQPQLTVENPDEVIELEKFEKIALQEAN